MLISGQTINMVSLFALIMTLGIIVDDAIVVAEYAQTCHENGDDAYIAAKNGASRMFLPVFTAAITTVAAFMPIFLISGIIGQVIEAIPLGEYCCFNSIFGRMFSYIAWPFIFSFK